MSARLKSHGPFLLLLIGAILILFWPAVIHPDHLLFPTFSAFSDALVIHWPKAHLMAQSWQNGEGLPLWTPLILSGMPLAANQLAMLFYPPAWLFLILPIEPVFNLLFICHLCLGGLGVYLLLHQAHDLPRGAALLGSLTFALSGKWLAHVAGGHISLVGAIGWMPWAVFGVMMLLKKPPSPGHRDHNDLLFRNLQWSLLAALALSMQILTHTLLVLYTGYLLAAMVGWYFIFLPASNRDRLAELRRLWLPLLVIPTLAGLLGAVQLLPLLELSRFSNRALSLAQAAEFAVTPLQLLIGLLLPTADGGHELVIYLGLVPLLLAPFGLTRQKRWSWFYGLLFLFCLMFALGPSTPIHRLFFQVVPGFRWVRTPARMFFVGALAISALVAFGLDKLARKEWSAAARRWLTRLAVAAGSLALLVGLGLTFGFGQTGRAALALTLLVPAGLALILLRIRQRLSTTAALSLLGLLLYLDLASFDLSMMRFVPPAEALTPGRPAAAYLAAEPGLFRVYSPSYSLPMQTAAAAGLQLADGVEPVHLAIYDRFIARAGGYSSAGFSVTIPNFGDRPPESALQQVEPNLKLLGLLNVAYLAAAFPMDWPGLTPVAELAGTFIYRNEQMLPRAWVAHRAVPAEPDWLAQLANLPELAGTVIVEDGPTFPDSAAARTPVTVTHYSANRIELETNIAAPGWLVLSEIWYPGWQATINDGPPQPVRRVNGLLRGIYLDRPGTYQLTVAYRPATVIWGERLSGLTAAGLILGLFLTMIWVRGRRPAQELPA